MDAPSANPDSWGAVNKRSVCKHPGLPCPSERIMMCVLVGLGRGKLGGGGRGGRGAGEVGGGRREGEGMEWGEGER